MNSSCNLPVLGSGWTRAGRSGEAWSPLKAGVLALWSLAQVPPGSVIINSCRKPMSLIGIRASASAQLAAVAVEALG